MRPTTPGVLSGAAAVSLAIVLAACSESTGPQEETGQLTIRFAAAPAGAAAAAAPDLAALDEPLIVTGTNGTLRIDDVRLIVAELELEGRADACPGRDDDEDDDDGDDGCEEIEVLPFLVDLPLDGGAVTVATKSIRAGTYDEIEFEVEDVDPDDDDDGEDAARRAAILAIRQELRGLYPLVPDDASVVVHGTFTPTGGQAREFTVYLDAEIEVEMDLDPPIVIPGDEAITIFVDPGLWFRDGQAVIDLSTLDGRLLDFELEIEHGFLDVEIEDD